MERKTKEFCITKKLREQDAFTINGISKNIGYFIKNSPQELWDKIHTRGSKLSLVRPAYAHLKEAINKINPKLLEKIEKDRELYKIKLRVINENKQGILGTPESKFRKKE